MTKLSVSVVIPCYNAAPFLRETLDSVLAQTHPSLEVLVVDDGSVDGTFQIAQEFADRFVVHRFSENRGKSVALNWAINRCRGEFVMILDADDLLEPDALELLTNYLGQHPDIGVAFGHASLFDAQGVIAERHPITEAVKSLPFEADGHWRRLDRQAFLQATIGRSYCAMCSTLFRRSCFVTVGTHNEGVRSGQDWEMLVRLANRYQFAFLDRVVSHVRRHDRNLSVSEIHRYSRLEGTSNALQSILSAVEVPEEVRSGLETRLVQSRLAWGRALLTDAEPAKARSVFRQVRASGGHVPVTWTSISYCPAWVLRRLLFVRKWLRGLVRPGAVGVPQRG